MNSKGFWYFLMIGAIGLWGISIIAGRMLYPHDQLKSWMFFAAVFAVHITEVPVIAFMFKDKDIPTGTVLVKTFLFGFTWWLPYKKGILNN